MKLTFKEPTKIHFDGHVYEFDGEVTMTDRLGEFVKDNYADFLVAEAPKEPEPEPKKEETKATPKSSK